MEKFFMISGIILWAAITLSALYFTIHYVWGWIKNGIVIPLSNIKFYLFGAKWTKNQNLAEVYFSRYANRLGIRTHWHSKKGFRNLAYYRLLKIAHADMPKYLKSINK